MKKQKIHFLKSMRGKLMIFFLCLGIISSGSVGILSIYEAHHALQEEAAAKLSVAAELKTQTIESFLESRFGEIHLITGLRIFQEVTKQIVNDVAVYNIHPSNDIRNIWKELAEKSPTYGISLQQCLTKYVQALGFYNEIKIVAVYDIKNADGEVVFKEGDQIFSVNGFTENRKGLSMYEGGLELMNNTKKGVYSDETGCSLLYASTIEHCAELDLASVHLSHGLPLPGLSAADLKKNSPLQERFSCMLIADVNVDAINALLNEETGMGETGESYLIGKVAGKNGYWMLSQARLSNNNTIFNEKISVDEALRVMDEKESERGTGICQNNIYEDYTGTAVLGHNHYLKIGENEWGLMTEIAEAEVFAASNKLITFIIILGSVIIVLIIIASLLIANLFAKPIVRVSEYASEIGEGNFDINIDASLMKRSDEIGLLSASFHEMAESLQYKGRMVEEVAKGNLAIDINLASDKDMLGKSLTRMSDSLNELLSQVNLSVDQVNLGADQVSQASQSLSQGATEQASSLEEISASITQVNSQSRQNAENALEANGIANQAASDAENGNLQMQNLSDAMGKINSSSDQIKKIVKVIDDIAFQTNLLALNANVEAARAGKYGKGFAVVADEVRNLAVRSAEAVKETTEMVDDSIKNIEEGNNAVEATAKQLDSIMNGSSRVAEFLAEIATASREQAEAIDQITQGLEQIDQVTQSNTASAEESAAASEELASQSIHLKDMVAAFKLKTTVETHQQKPRQLAYNTSAPSKKAGAQRALKKQNLPSEVISLDDDEDFDRF